MGDKELKELKDNGYIVIKRLRAWVAFIITVLLFIIGQILSPVFAFGGWKSEITNSVKTNTVNIGINSNRIQSLNEDVVDSFDVVKEIKFNLKALMEANGLKYIEDTNK